ncbi:MAG: class I SAM-dependent methyltransferase [Hormoscilla sp. SP5CHS1]|nr:class I SAM-dependent methyltransferase [Hormoscilla sp. SP12CHS1]MBC6452114.1 class I SAM-dependent methyltransferase [Hormoscilla sp. SP5CHS1]
MTNKLKPNWTGDDLLSRFVNLLIQTKPIYQVMKRQARQVMIKTAEKNGVPWRQTYQELEASGAKGLLSDITNPNVRYPDYYRKPFHAYEEGDLCWQAAFEAIPATQAMALRVGPQENFTGEKAHHRMLDTFHQVLDEYSPSLVKDVLDMGCSVGMSTVPLHRYYCQRQKTKVRTVGLDLSPYMLAVAKTVDVNGDISEWIHANAEKTGLPENSFDVVTLKLVLHHLPRHATRNVFQEALRVLRPGGCLAIFDQDPRSPVLQNLPPALFVLLKSTEPWLDDYHTFDVEAAMQEVGFQYKTTVASDPRHRTIVGIKPN